MFTLEHHHHQFLTLCQMEMQTQMHRICLNPFLTFYIHIMLNVDANANVKCEQALIQHMENIIYGRFRFDWITRRMKHEINPVKLTIYVTGKNVCMVIKNTDTLYFLQYPPNSRTIVWRKPALSSFIFMDIWFCSKNTCWLFEKFIACSKFN